jgi:hypothetical protein
MARASKAFDLIVEGQEPLTGQVEAVVGPQLAVGDVDEDLLLEIEQLENGQGVSLAVDGAQVVARECELGSRRSVGDRAARRSGIAQKQRSSSAGERFWFDGDRRACDRGRGPREHLECGSVPTVEAEAATEWSGARAGHAPRSTIARASSR